ncbi:hypothetical protein MTYP_02399 [Methylophilaceae bacterium]|nr:hypothetical protein MTYP_02399 [Methylophilaceae bacterium]
MTKTGNGLPAFQQYQLHFAAHLRDPNTVAKPPRVADARMRVYRALVFNNLDSTLGQCFPVCRKVAGLRLWRKLIRGFLAHHRAQGPLFRQIPEEFLQYLQAARDSLPPLPGYFAELAHYEWMELAIAALDAAPDWSCIDTAGDLMRGRPVLAPALALLHYDYPVQRISPRYRPQAPEPVDLLVFRDAGDEVRFIELNPASACLLALLQRERLTGEAALHRVAGTLPQVDPEAVVTYGTSLLYELKARGAILGIYSTA